MAGLHRDRLFPPGGRVHQCVPIASPPAPAPGGAEAVQAQSCRGGGGAGEHRLATEAGGDPLAEPIRAGGMAAEKGNGEVALGIYHHHGRITVLVRKQRGDQTSHEPAGPDDHKGTGRWPLIRQAVPRRRLVVWADPAIDQARLGQPFQQGRAGCTEAQCPDRTARRPIGVAHGVEAGMGRHAPSFWRNPDSGPWGLGLRREPSAFT